MKIISALLGYLAILVTLVGVYYKTEYPSLYNVAHFILGASVVITTLVFGIINLIITVMGSSRYLEEIREADPDSAVKKVSTFSKCFSFLWGLGLAVLAASQGWYVIASICFINIFLSQYFFDVHNEAIDKE
jgi:hypothetical protein